MDNKTWMGLKTGDRVDIVAPGMKPQPGTLRRASEFLSSWGLKARFGENLTGKDLLCANTREFRFKSLKKALLAKDSKMVWCLRGGYGSLHLLKSLKDLPSPGSCKLFMGLSDITSLHTFFVQDWGWPTLHGCNLDYFANGQGTKAQKDRFKKVLFGLTKALEYPLKPLNPSALRDTKILAPVIGGNLTTLQSGLGTEFQVQTKNSIVFFEDVGERAYRVDRILEQMDQLDLFKKAKAVIFGLFTDCREPGGKNLIPSLLKQFARFQKCPVFYGLKSGHGPNQHPLPLGTKAQIFCGSQPRIRLETGVRKDPTNP